MKKRLILASKMAEAIAKAEAEAWGNFRNPPKDFHEVGIKAIRNIVS